MSTISRDEHSLREMMSAYDAGQPREVFRAQLHERLRTELMGATCKSSATSPRAARRVASLWWSGFVTAAVVLGVAGIVMRPGDAPRETAERESTAVTEIAKDIQPRPVLSPREQANAIRDAREDKDDGAPALARDADENLSPEDLGPGDLAPEGERSGPTQFVLHSDALAHSPEERRWRRAWCLLEEADEPAEVFDRWRSACDEEIEDAPANDEMAYRIQSALMARAQLESLVEPLLASEADEAPFVDALSEVNVDNVDQMLAQFAGDMATSAKLYLELLLRSREDNGIALLDVQLHRALASRQLDDSRRDLVRRWIEHLDAEKQRRQSGPVMM